MRQITSATVIDLWHHMEKQYHSSHTSKSDSGMMRMIGYFLNGLGILDKGKFLERYTTTIGNVIYIPFRIGVTDDRYSLRNQLMTCVHEHQHVVQWQRGGISFMLEYLTDSARRAVYEVEAMSSTLEMYWWYNRTVPDIPRMALKLVEYNCKKDDIVMSEKMLRTISKTVQRGAVTTSAGKTAIAHLQANGV